MLCSIEWEFGGWIESERFWGIAIIRSLPPNCIRLRRSRIIRIPTVPPVTSAVLLHRGSTWVFFPSLCLVADSRPLPSMYLILVSGRLYGLAFWAFVRRHISYSLRFFSPPRPITKLGRFFAFLAGRSHRPWLLISVAVGFQIPGRWESRERIIPSRFLWRCWISRTNAVSVWHWY